MTTRKQRGLMERIYLLEAKLESNKWNLSVKGSSKKIYQIILSKNKAICGCMDFYVRQNVCKHMYFILGKILKNTQILGKINTVKNINENFNKISNALKNRLKNHISCEKNIKYDDNETCCICFEEFGKEDVDQCKLTCKNVFHSNCINLWLSKNNSCPLCRATWVDSNSDDPLEEFKGLKL